ncbi:MAG: hypothetical protein PHO42_05570 [Candidatus Omnitrophica bacterium]|nr:hypothetical protein [Candidatus Omnitrophota bacterium]
MFLYGDLAAWALIFIAIAMAYFVLSSAAKEGNKLFKLGGYVIGLFILVLSLILMVTNLTSRMRRQEIMQNRMGSTAAPRPFMTPNTRTPVLPRRTVGVPQLPTMPTTPPAPQQPVSPQEEKR